MHFRPSLLIASMPLLAGFMTYGAAGIALGLVVNRLNAFLDDRVPRAYASPWVSVLLKLLLVALALLAAQVASQAFARDWQSTTAGLFFVSFYFGLQSSLMEDVARLAG